MGRSLRAAEGGYVYHVLNRANARLPLFEKEGDYAAFERILQEACERYPANLLAYCIMPNHWHLVVWPQKDGVLSRFVGWLTLTHTQRYHAHYHSTGHGHVYQGRFKSFPVQEDAHFLTLCRYVERNALRANLAARAEDWRWSSLWWHAQTGGTPAWLAAWPMARPARWLSHVNAAHSETELEAIRRSVQRGQPYGDEAWSKRTVTRLALELTMRPRGRPRKTEKGS
jgi:REP-associated tyrosine transposase